MPPRLAVASGPRSATRAAAEHLNLATRAEEEALAVSSATDGDVEDLRSELHAVAEQHRLMHHLLLSPPFSRERPPAHRPGPGSPP
jgi:hypothetical protein